MRTQSGALAGALGPLFGVGPGAGMSLLIALGGVAALCVGLSGYLVPAIRKADSMLPDHDALPAAEAVPAD